MTYQLDEAAERTLRTLAFMADEPIEAVFGEAIAVYEVLMREALGGRALYTGNPGDLLMAMSFKEIVSPILKKVRER